MFRLWRETIFAPKLQPSRTNKKANKICPPSANVKNVELRFSRTSTVCPKQIPSANKNKAHKTKIVVSFLIVFILLNRTEMNSL